MLLTIFCRIFQFFLNIGTKLLPWRKAICIEGAGSIREIPRLLGEKGVKKPIIVTFPGFVRRGLAARLTDILEKAHYAYEMYSEVEANPSVHTVNKIFELYRSGGCDSFIALGGGSSIDAAKAAAARAVRPGKSVNQMGGLFRIMKKLPFFIAIPTTAGTGSETTVAALITDSETHHKYSIIDLNLVPDYAILDPELTVSLAPATSAATGMDALTHAVESYLCRTCRTGETIEYALDAVRSIFKNLPEVYRNGENLEARQAMLTASFKAGVAFSRTGVGNVHAIAHTLGGLYNTPHGLANAVILPIVLEDYGRKITKKLVHLGDAAGITGGSSSDEEKAQGFINAIYDMNAKMGIPKGFDFIKSEDIPKMCSWASKESNPVYPVPVVYDKARFRKIINILKNNAVQ